MNVAEPVLGEGKQGKVSAGYRPHHGQAQGGLDRVQGQPQHSIAYTDNTHGNRNWLCLYVLLLLLERAGLVVVVLEVAVVVVLVVVLLVVVEVVATISRKVSCLYLGLGLVFLLKGET